MRLASVGESRLIDELTQSEFDVPAELLMEAAGACAAKEILAADLYRRTQITVICGPGNNGADGLVVARHLHSAFRASKSKVFIATVAPPDKRSELFSRQLVRCEKAGIECRDLLSASAEEIRATMSSAHVLVDAIFGIGLTRAVSSPYKEIIETMNEVPASIVSLDTPSGLDADRGVSEGAVVKAARTLTFGLAKPGFFVSDGPACVGQLTILPIGFPAELTKRCAVTRSAFTGLLARKYLPKRAAGSHKSDHGHALLFAGSAGMWGAGLLASSSAYRTGAGYVTLASNAEPTDVLLEFPEVMTARLNDKKIWEKPKWTAVGIGPGFGTGEQTYQILKRLIDHDAKSVVVDADAITVIAEKGMRELPPNWILTPHAGELSRIIRVSAKEIESDRFRYAEEASSLLGCHVLLKGYRTVIATKKKSVVVLSGNSALAKAGTGDVLTGIITGLLAQKLSPLIAASLGAYLHGLIADRWVRSGKGRSTLQASDLRELLPNIMGETLRGEIT